MRSLKGFVSLLLTVCLVSSMMATSALAASGSETVFTVDSIHYKVIGENEVAVYNPNWNEDVAAGGEASAYTGAVSIPATVNYNNASYRVTEIDGVAFFDAAVSSVILPDSIVEIGDSAFSDCEADTITLGSGLRTIGARAFHSCQFASLTIPDGVETIGDEAFGACSELTTLTIPGSVRTIGSQAFSGCGKLTNLTFNEGLISIGESAFQLCPNLSELTIPASVTTLTEELGTDDSIFTAFDHYQHIDNVRFAEGSPFIVSDGILYNNNSMITFLSENLGDVTIPAGVTEIPPEFFAYQDTLTGVVVPVGVTDIPDLAFACCVNLQRIQLPEGISSIGDLAFCLTDDNFANKNPQLEFINIPATVTSVGGMFLGGVKTNGSTALIFEGATLPTFTEYEGVGALAGISGDGINAPTIYYPAEAKEAYTGSNSPLKDLANENGAYGLSLADNGLTKSATYNPSITVPTGAVVECSSSNENVATVSYDETNKKIVVTGVNAGTADITVKMSINGFTLLEDTCTVTVTEDGAVIPTVEEPEVEIPTEATIQDGKTNSVKSSAGTTEIKDSTLTDAAALEAATTTASEKNAAISQAKNELGSAVSENDLKIYTQTYLDIQPTAYSETTSDGKTTVSLTLEITPMVRTVASTASNSNDIVIKENDTTLNANAVVATGSEKPLNIGSATKISIDLGGLNDAFKNATIYIKHEKNGHNYFYRAESDADGKLEFTSKHGFSPFTFSLTSQAVATIGEGDNTVGYETFADAVADVQNGETITVVDGTGDLTASMSGSSKTINVKNGTTSEITVKVNGDEKKIAADGTQSFTYTRPSSGGPSNATLTFETNGGTAIAKVTKAVGTTIDLTDYEPTREGYTFDGWYSDKELTKEITSVKLSSSMTVYAKWTKGHDCPSAHFTDVDTKQWYHESVDYVVENGLMQGTSKTTFAPNLTTTRGMIVTILYRLENEPSVSGACPFDDVKTDSWYEDAVTWAAANKIVDGYGDAKFGPEDNITREQMAAILYRYAQFKGYDVTESAELDSFTDAAQVSDWALTAMQWACGESLIQGDANKLMPTGNATRAQVAAILMRFIENIAK